MNTWKPNLEETKKHYLQWWNHEGIVLNMWDHFQEGVAPHGPYADEDPIRLAAQARNNYGTGGNNLPGAPVPKDNNQRWFDPQWRAAFLDWYVGHSCLKADMLPVANTQLGPGSLAAILGGVFEGGDDTIWIHPDPNYTDDLKFDPEHPNFLLHKDILRACKEKAQGRYYVGMPDLMEGLDVLAAIKGTDKVLMDTVMQPEVVERQMQFINDVYFKVFDELYDIIREGDEMAFCYFSSWAPGKMTKLQCDISTMISEDDYRRFVQPFLRQQTEKIDYTLYHLDGVGAVHHLPAILDIKELNAIQWTPGVGEPQGGSSKWYDLYRQILDAGKSIMACWVTLDELRPLLDNVGSNGIHLEMDFHNEEEVEQALEIVEQCRQNAKPLHAAAGAANPLPADADEAVAQIIAEVEDEASGSNGLSASISALPVPERPSLDELMQQRILIFDGGMGTAIQSFKLTGTKGNNEYLCVERPDVISEIHRRFLAAGSDIITTNTFNAQRLALGDSGLADQVRPVNKAAVALARQQADMFTMCDPSRPRYVLGGMGPTRETPSLEGSKVTKEQLRAIYREQAEALLEAGVDGIINETIFDTLGCTACIEAIQEAMKTTRREVPIFLSFTIKTADGHNMIGQDIIEFVKTLKDLPIFCVGVNCSPDIEAVSAVIARLAAETPFYISVFPNAGMPLADGSYPVTPEQFQRQLWPIFAGQLVNMAGGCCGTTDAHIAALSELTHTVPGCWLTPHRRGMVIGAATAPATSAETAPPADSAAPATAADPGEEVFQAIVAGKTDATATATESAFNSGLAPQDIINDHMVRAMSEVGQRFQDGKAFVPQLLMAGRAMKAGLGWLAPHMSGDDTQSLGKIIIGTVKGDLHDIGKNLCASMLEGCGFEVINIGIDISAEAFIEAIREHNPDILALSALLTTTMPEMKTVIDALKEAGIRDQVKVIVGGAPVSEQFANEIGADGYSDNANECVAVAKKVMGIE